MNKKGFTLVELLATIVIIAVVTGVGTVSIINIKKKIEQNMFKSKLELAVTAAKNWGQDNKELFTENGVRINSSDYLGTRISIADLINAKYLDSDAELCNCYKTTNNRVCSRGTMSADKSRCYFSQTTNKVCPSGYTKYNNMCYRYLTSIYTLCNERSGKVINGTCYLNRTSLNQCPGGYYQYARSSSYIYCRSNSSYSGSYHTHSIPICNKGTYYSGYCYYDQKGLSELCYTQYSDSTYSGYYCYYGRTNLICPSGTYASGSMCVYNTVVSSQCPNGYEKVNGKCQMDVSCSESGALKDCNKGFRDNDGIDISNTKIKVYIDSNRVYSCIDPSSIMSVQDAYSSYLCK